MSAYIVAPETIDMLVAGLADFCIPIEGEQTIRAWVEPQSTAQALLEENYRSVNFLYNENTPTPKHQFTFNAPICDDKYLFKTQKQLVGLVGCIRCYQYQACETDDWEESPVCKALESLMYSIAVHLCKLSGEKMPWGIETKEELMAYFTPSEQTKTNQQGETK